MEKTFDKKSQLAHAYATQLRKQLQQELGLGNIMEVPRLEKIVLNVGVKRLVGDSKTFQFVEKVLSDIAGQAARRTLARKSIASFKIREGMPVGVCVTLRRQRMYAFLDKLIRLSLPKVRDFQGVSTKLDGRGNYNLGIREWAIFAEADDLHKTQDAKSAMSFGLNITMHTSAQNDQHAYALLKGLGIPFKK